MNGYLWRVYIVPANSPELVDRTGERRVATTDGRTHCIYLSNQLQGNFLITVLVHELGHCIMISYNLLYDIHKMVKPEFWIDAEEWICNFIADYGLKIFSVAYSLLGDYALQFIPHELEKMIG